MMWELEKFNPSYCLKITVSLCACTKCAHGVKAFVLKMAIWSSLLCHLVHQMSNWCFIYLFICFYWLLCVVYVRKMLYKNSTSYPKLILKRVEYNHKVVTVHKLCRAALYEMTPQIPNLCVIASDIVIMHWHSIPALVGHKNVLLNRQHKHADKLHLYAIKLRHLLTPKMFLQICRGDGSHYPAEEWAAHGC